MASEPTSPDDDRSHVDATVSPPPRPSPPSVSTQETGGSTNASDSTATPPVQEVPENSMTALTIRAITRPIPVWQVADHEKESEGPQLHDGPPGPPRFPHELDDSLAKKVDNERAASTSFENRLQHEVICSREQAAQETGDSTVGDCTAAPILQEEVTQGGTTASTIHAINDDDPPVPLLQVADHENETAGPQLHDGPPGPQYSLSEFDDSLAKSIENEFEQHSSDHPRDNSSTVHSTMEAPVANAAAVGPPMGGGFEEGRAPSEGSAPPTSPPTREEAATAGAVGLNLNLDSAGEDIAVAYRVDEYPEGMPGRGIVYEAEPIEPQEPIVASFYERKSFVYVMVGMTLLVIGIAMAVQLSNNSNGIAGRAKATNNPSISDVPTTTGYPTNNPTTSNVPTKNLTFPPTGSPTLRPTDYPTNNPTTSNNPTKNPTMRPTGSPTLRPTNYPTVSTYRAKLLSPDGATGDEFGGSVAIYGDTIVVGADADDDVVGPGKDDDKGDGSGSAHVFVRSGEEWTHKAKLLAPNREAYDSFGYSVAIYRDTIVVGAPYDGVEFWSGSAHAFARNGEEWRYHAKLLAPYVAELDNFGTSVAIYEDTIVVGASREGGLGPSSAQVFVRSREEWTHQAKLLAPDGVERDYFGGSVAIYEDTIVVGAYREGDDSGSAHVFVRSGEEWSHQAKLLAPDGAAYDYFGYSVAIHGDTLVVGTQYDNNGLHAYVFVRSGGEWTHKTKLLAPDGAWGDWFGHSVAIYGNVIAVGAPRDGNNGSANGSAHVFVRNGEEWTHKAKLLAPDGAANDKFGYSVAIYGDDLVVGANEHDNNRGSNSGSAYVFAVVQPLIPSLSPSSSKTPTSPTLIPSLPPSSSSHPSCGSLMMIQIQYDSYPGETSYELERIASKDGQETKLASHSGSTGDNNHEESICLGDGLYSFSFYDSYGDGFNGEYSLTLVPGETIITRDNSVSLYGEQVLFRLPFDRATIDVRWIGSDGQLLSSLPSLSPSSSIPPSSSNNPTNLPTRTHLPTVLTWSSSLKLLAPDGAAGDRFGWSTAIYQDTIVVGAHLDDDIGDRSGSAHVFFRSGEEWTHQAKLLAPDGVAGDRFGNSVAIHEDTIVVGAGRDDDNGRSSGSAHVFVRSGEEWTHEAKLLAPDGAVGDWFGESVAIYGDIIVVGAQGDDGIGCDIEPGLDDDIGCDFGSAHVFVRSGKKWTHKAKLLAPDRAAFDYFGVSVAIYEDTVVVGADGRGSAHVFVRSGEEWTHQAKLLAPDGAMFDFFGSSVAIYGDTIVVGAPGDGNGNFGDESGSAHVFVRSGMRWSRQVKLLVPDGAAGDWFGEDVAIYGNNIVIGASRDDDKGESSGSAHVFVQSGVSWTHQAKLLAPEGQGGCWFGGSTAIYQDTIVAGASGEDDRGSVHVFVT